MQLLLFLIEFVLKSSYDLTILISVAYLTLLERKVMAAIQRRRGPSVIGGNFGILQPFADGLKLFVKEIYSSKSNKFLFIFSPILFLGCFINLVVNALNINAKVSDLNLGVLYILAISSLSVYGLILAGWSSNSQYAFLGALVVPRK